MSNIELYLDKMKELLNSDILRKILTYINIDIIKKQKLLKIKKIKIQNIN